MEKYAESFKKLSNAVKGTPVGAEDFFDKLNYAMTPAILLAIAAIISTKQYVFKPIQCWSLQELDNHRMQYVENYCWVEDTFYYDLDKPIPSANETGAAKRISYYQWVPFMLMVQAILFHIPHVLWLMLSNNAGIDITQIATQSQKMEQETDESGRTKKVKFLAGSLLKFLQFRERSKQKSWCSCIASCMFGPPAFGMYLLFSYLVVKVVYIGICVGQLHLMRAYLGLNMSTFGLALFNDIMHNRTWEVTHVFPRVTFCHLDARRIGTLNRYNVQCVLPVNMLNERFYIFIWFWVVVLAILNVYSFFKSIMEFLLSPSRRRLVRKHLKIAEYLRVNGFRRQRNCEWRFVDEVLKTDGAFVLAIISKNAGYLSAVEVLAVTFQSWLAQAGIREEDSDETGEYHALHEQE